MKKTSTTLLNKRLDPTGSKPGRFLLRLVAPAAQPFRCVYKIMNSKILIFFMIMAFITPCYALEHFTKTEMNGHPLKIVIDPGFGGKDTGPKCKEQTYSKDVNLEIAKKLQKKLQEELNLVVLLTRNDDSYITLEKRTAFANNNNADLFISIHTNGSKDKSVYGTETFFLNITPEPDTTNLSTMNNSTSPQDIEIMEKIVSDLKRNTTVHESKLLANNIQFSLYTYLKSKYSHIKNRGVKQSLFYVLFGAQMPSVMIQPSFITNELECERLITDEYQNDICIGIIEGIKAFIRERSK